MLLAEWLQPDGLGGFASGTVDGTRTRRYHAVLLAARTPPTGRVVLVNGFEAWLDTPNGRYALTSQRYDPDVVYPDGKQRIDSFAPTPWPSWRLRLENGLEVHHELVTARGTPLVALRWRLVGETKPEGPATLIVRPLLSGRDVHSTHHENPAFSFDASVSGDRVSWQPYASLPRIVSRTNGRYAHDPVWYRNFLYEEERARGLDYIEDLGSPGRLEWDLAAGEAVWIVGAEIDGIDPHADLISRDAVSAGAGMYAAERARQASFPTPLHGAADAYIVARGSGRTIIAGYPWFADWGRDTFIALRGVCIAAGRPVVATDILVAWAGEVSQGMLPNLFPEQGAAPEYNSVDASLWYVIAVGDLLADVTAKVLARDRRKLRDAVQAILDGYSRGTRYGIRSDDDGLLAAGEPGVQLTWMDAKIGDWVVTPRIGKPVEIQALWLNALAIGATVTEDARWSKLFTRGIESFRDRFWHAAGGYLYDVIDMNHEPGAVDASFRPNQIFAVGGLPRALLDGLQARQVVDAVEARLWTPLGLRTLAPGEPGYTPTYEGDVHSRDAAYHQGTVWPWLLGSFTDAWVRVRGSTAAARRDARVRFLEPLLRHLEVAGLGHISEIADAEPPHTPRGCPFQAWSVGETLRLAEVVLSDARTEAPRAKDPAYSIPVPDNLAPARGEQRG
jgi:predicted glycogen debranching enzyme